MAKSGTAPVLFLIAAGLFVIGAIRDGFFPTLLSHPPGRPAVWASLAVVFLIIGAAGRRRSRL
ncbi:MAG: hypothetical protein ABI818_20660 [Acidobacteriota bacterium]